MYYSLLDLYGIFSCNDMLHDERKNGNGMKNEDDGIRRKLETKVYEKRKSKGLRPWFHKSLIFKKHLQRMI